MTDGNVTRSDVIKNKIFQHNSNLLVGLTFSLTCEEARVGDLVKAYVEIKFILFIEKTDLVSYIHNINRIRNIHTEKISVYY